MIGYVNHQPLTAVAAASLRKSLLYTHFGGFAALQTAFALFIDVVNEKSKCYIKTGEFIYGSKESLGTQ